MIRIRAAIILVISPAVCQYERVPDSCDYETFFGLLDHPDRWTDVDQRSVEFALTEQRQLLAACHPKDHRRRKSLASIVEQIEAALARNR